MSFREFPSGEPVPAYSAETTALSETVHEVTDLPEERSKLPFSTRLYELKPIERARVICLTSIEEPLAVDALPVSIRLTV